MEIATLKIGSSAELGLYPSLTFYDIYSPCSGLVYHPFPSRKLDSTLFVADSYEDLSNDLVVKQAGGLPSLHETSSASVGTEYDENGRIFMTELQFLIYSCNAMVLIHFLV